MFLVALACLTLSRTPLCCPTSLEELKGAPTVTMEYGGALFGTCCGNCDAAFKADPKAEIAKAI
ncbi:MAG TPA: hypothetical protein VHE55_02000 [Fimbriimonadaceae bacterium]|nr:hypothetical protein [Fimbriimonadaceae bacterium]